VIGLEAALGMRQETRVCPAQIAVAGLLEMPVAQLTQAVEREIAGNPALEVAQPSPGRLGAGWAAGEVERVAAPPAVAHTILAEAAIGAGDRWIAERLLADLDPRGRLGRSPQEAAQWLGVAPARVDRVLRALREVTDPELGAADLRDALLLQADALPDAPDLLRPLICLHLDDVAAGRWPAIAAALSVDLDVVMSTVDYLRERLRPGSYDGAAVTPIPMVRPDIMLSAGTGDELVVSLMPTHPPLIVDPSYERIAANPGNLSHDAAARVRAQVAAAGSFIEQLARRDGTLSSIAEAVMRRQASFVAHGPRGHQSLTRNDIADELGVHPSTVSRAVSGKTVRLPNGTHLPFAEFFGGAVSACDVLAELLSAESAPMSDAALARALAARGVQVARRTVAKYRARLRLSAHTAR
jgi:RNA polymerase sigma-54 factor